MRDQEQEVRVVSPVRRPSYLLLSIFLSLTCGIGAVGYRYYQARSQALEASVREMLAAVADMKVREVESWRRTLLAEARSLFAVAPLIGPVRQVLTGSEDHAVIRSVEAWLDTLRETHHYTNAMLFDSRARLRVFVGARLGNAEHVEDSALGVCRASSPIITDFHRDGNQGPLHLGLHIPIRSSVDISRSGALLIGVDPRVALYPTLREWPTQSRTAEVILAQRSGDRVLFLTDLRHPAGRHLRSEPLSKRWLPAVQAVLGREGIVEGTDYRGMKVVACLRHVPDTPWSLVAKVDAEEVYAPLRQDSLIFAVLVALFILGSAAMVGWIWRNQSARFYRQKYESEMERRALLGHYDYLTRYANDVILLMDESGRIVEANDRAVDTYGYSREELLKSTISRLRAPSTLAQLQKQWSSVEEQRGLLFETLHLRRDGGEFPVEVSTRLIEIDGRKYRQSIIRDISERKQAETRIRSLNRLYAVLSGCSQVMVHARSEVELFQQVCRLSVELGGFALAWVGMIDAKTNRVNPVASAGESVPYLREITISAYQGPEAQGPVGSSIRSGRPAICNKIETDAAMTLWHDAARRWNLHSVTALPLRLGGKIVGILALYSSKAGFFNEEQVALAVEVACSVSYAMDSLEQERRRKHVEAELLASRERLEMALDAANEGLWDWCLTDDSSYLSPRYNTMLGYAPGELKSGTAEWYSLIHPEDRGRVERAVRDFIAGSAEPYSVEFRMRSKSGVYAWILSQGKVVGRDADGKPTRLVGTHTDITERKRLEEEFLQAQKLESIGRLAGGVAHDFNNHLTVINGYASLLLNRVDSADPIREHIAEIQAAGERAAALTRQLLSFSRKQVIAPEVLDLNRVVADVEKMLGRLLGENVRLLTRLHCPLRPVVVDVGQMHQVLMNLAVNARDAMPRGGELTIETANADVDEGYAAAHPGVACGSYVLLSVSDTGIGMNEEVRQHIFEPFFTTKEEGAGTGLGLSTVYGIVRQSRGYIGVESEPGKGSVFRIYLPHTERQANEAKGTAQFLSDGEEMRRAVPGSDGARRSILVLDSDESICSLLREILEPAGYLVQAGCHPGTVARGRGCPIDLVLADIATPGSKGLEDLRDLRHAQPAIKVIAMSGAFGGNYQETASLLGVRATIRKPVDPSQLLALVRTVLED